MATTLKANLIIPEVLADYVEAKLTNKSVFAPLANIDSTLVGTGGDTIKFPKYAYIGKADVTAENGQITPVALSASTVQKTVHKLTKAVQITDEARLSAYGDPMGEAASQIARAFDDKTDDEFLAEMEGATLVYGVTGDFKVNDIVDALALFGEDEDGVKALCVSPKDLAAIRKDDDYINGSEIATGIMLRGATGMIWGCQLINTNRLNGDANERDAYIVKPGALSLIMKRGVVIETEREPEYMRDTVYGSKHAVAYLKDESKIIRIRIFTGLSQKTSGITSTAGTAATNGTFIAIDEAAPAGYKWVYKLGTADVTPTFGTAVTSYTDWVDGETEIAASTNTKASVVLVNAADNKPVEYANVTLVKKA